MPTLSRNGCCLLPTNYVPSHGKTRNCIMLNPDNLLSRQNQLIHAKEIIIMITNNRKLSMSTKKSFKRKKEKPYRREMKEAENGKREREREREISLM